MEKKRDKNKVDKYGNRIVDYFLQDTGGNYLQAVCVDYDTAVKLEDIRDLVFYQHKGLVHYFSEPSKPQNTQRVGLIEVIYPDDNFDVYESRIAKYCDPKFKGIIDFEVTPVEVLGDFRLGLGRDSKVKLVSVPRKDISIENIPELFDPDEHSKVERDYDDDDGILKTGIRNDEYLYRNDHNYDDYLDFHESVNNLFNESIYYTSLGLGTLYDVYESLYEINNFRKRLTEGAALGTPQEEESRFDSLRDKAVDAINGLVNRVSLSSDNVMQKRFTAAEELVIKVIEQQYKMASDTKTQNYGTIVRTCGRALQQLIQNTLRQGYLNTNTQLNHINGEPVNINDFTMEFYMEMARKKTGIDFRTLLVA